MSFMGVLASSGKKRVERPARLYMPRPNSAEEGAREQR
jgi:hypothetical protein